METYLSLLEDSDEIEEVRKEIFSYHEKFQKDLDKLQNHSAEILDGQSEETINLYFKLVEIMN